MLGRRTLLTATAATGVAVATGPVAAHAHDRGRGHGRDRDILIRGGRVLSMDPEVGELNPGDVLVRDGKIHQIAERIHARRSVEVIDATGMYVIPGLVDAHKHMWETLVRGISVNANGREHRDLVLDPLPDKLTTEDFYYGTLAGALDAIDHGTTTILNWDLGGDTFRDTEAAVEALKDARIRALHSFSASYQNQNDPNSRPSEDDIRSLVELVSENSLLSVHMGLRNPVNRGEQVLQRVIRDFELADELGLTTSIHAGLPTSQATPGLLNDHGLLRPTLTFVNGSAFEAAEFALLAANGCSVITAPEVEMQSATPPPLRLLLDAGLKPMVCTDSYAYTSGHLFTQGRMLLQFARSQNIQGADGMLTMEEAFAWMGVNPAMSLGMSNRIGSLTPGKQADIVLLDTRDDLSTLATVNPFADLFTMSNSNNIKYVIVDGKIVKRDGELVGHNLRQIRRKVRKLQERLLTG